MPRWEAVATFALVAFILSALYYFALGFIHSAVRDWIPTSHPLVVVIAFWLLPSLLLLALAIAYDVWRRERVIADAVVLIPICLMMPVLAVATLAVTACASDACMS